MALVFGFEGKTRKNGVRSHNAQRKWGIEGVRVRNSENFYSDPWIADLWIVQPFLRFYSDPLIRVSCPDDDAAAGDRGPV